jgi:hypothetical protein
VICIRHPADVAASLRRRDGFEQERSVALWLRYTRSILAVTSERPRIVISFDDLWESAAQPLDRLAAFLDRSEAARAPSFRDAVSEWLDGELWHHRAGAARTPEANTIDPDAIALYGALREAASSGGIELAQPVARHSKRLGGRPGPPRSGR